MYGLRLLKELTCFKEENKRLKEENERLIKIISDLKTMNQVSIIINGTRYDAVEAPKATACNICCDLYNVCKNDISWISDFCLGLDECRTMCFKKSTDSLNKAES